MLYRYLWNSLYFPNLLSNCNVLLWYSKSEITREIIVLIFCFLKFQFRPYIWPICSVNLATTFQFYLLTLQKQRPILTSFLIACLLVIVSKCSSDQKIREIYNILFNISVEAVHLANLLCQFGYYFPSFSSNCNILLWYNKSEKTREIIVYHYFNLLFFNISVEAVHLANLLCQFGN